VILYLDPFAGASGDMFLGLLLDLGVPLEVLQEGLGKLGVEGWTLAARREKRRGIEGTRAVVGTAETSHHRTWSDIDRLLAASALDARPRELARSIFRRLGEAEAAVHGIPLEQVHFHEVGALDALVDIVGSAIGLCHLAPEEIISGPLPAATGTVQTAHGTYPLPAPATLRLLEGWPLFPAGSGMEWVTPTGAAILTSIASPGPFPAMTLQQGGYGVGSRDPETIPNLLRGLLGEQGTTDGLERDRVSVIETHLDDASPEALGFLMELLFEAGALDVAYTPLQMKKNRPGVQMTVIAEPARQEALAGLILRQSSAIGVRFSSCERLKLRRETSTVRTVLGEARVKRLYDGTTLLRVTPEFDSCRELARASGKPLTEVYRLVEETACQAPPPGDP